MEAAELIELGGIPGSDMYEVGEEVGHGTFSEVYAARERASGRPVALKHMYLAEPGQPLPKHIEREAAALRAIQHPNVISLLGFHQRGIGVTLALELCLTDLRRVLELRGNEPLDPALAKSVIQQLLRAVHACHQAGYMHRDIAPSNLLVARGSGLIKLSDFGQARGSVSADGGAATSAAHAADAAGGEGHMSPTVGTLWYKAPEILFSSRSYTPAVDLWSAGAVCAELLAGRPLFPGSSQLDQVCRLMEGLGTIAEEEWPGVRELPDWGKLIFKPSPGKGWEQLLPGVPPAALDLVRGLMQYNPERRLSADAALALPYFSDAPAPAGPEALAALAEELLSRKRQAAQQQWEAAEELEWDGM